MYEDHPLSRFSGVVQLSWQLGLCSALTLLPPSSGSTYMLWSPVEFSRSGGRFGRSNTNWMKLKLKIMKLSDCLWRTAAAGLPISYRYNNIKKLIILYLYIYIALFLIYRAINNRW